MYLAAEREHEEVSLRSVVEVTRGSGQLSIQAADRLFSPDEPGERREVRAAGDHVEVLLVHQVRQPDLNKVVSAIEDHMMTKATDV